jgi:hypothetical protein
MDMTHPDARFAETRHHVATTAGLVVVFWMAAAAAVTAAQTELQPISPAGATVASIAAIVLAAWCYTRFCAQCAGISHALGVGIAWLALGIVTELVMVTRAGHGWFGVLGSPDRPLLRNVIFFVWIFSPAIFARREDQETAA